MFSFPLVFFECFFHFLGGLQDSASDCASVEHGFNGFNGFNTALGALCLLAGCRVSMGGTSSSEGLLSDRRTFSICSRQTDLINLIYEHIYKNINIFNTDKHHRPRGLDLCLILEDQK